MTNSSRLVWLNCIQAWVDAGIAALVERLNKAGYRTSYSCSGLWCEHKEVGTVSLELSSFTKCGSLYLGAATLRKGDLLAAAAHEAGMSVFRFKSSSTFVLDVQGNEEEMTRVTASLLSQTREIITSYGSQTRRARRRRYAKVLSSLLQEAECPSHDQKIRERWQLFERALFSTAA